MNHACAVVQYVVCHPALFVYVCCHICDDESAQEILCHVFVACQVTLIYAYLLPDCRDAAGCVSLARDADTYDCLACAWVQQLCACCIHVPQCRDLAHGDACWQCADRCPCLSCCR